MQKRIIFTDHAFKRLSERCFRFGIDVYEAIDKSAITITRGKVISAVLKKIV